MPVRGSIADCWSCGLPARDESAVPREARKEQQQAPPRARAARFVVGAAGLGVVVALVLVSVAVLVPTERTSTVRRLVDRIRGDDWHQVATPGFSIDLPAKPVETAWPPGSGHPAPGRTWQATSGNVVATVTSATLPGTAAAIDGQATARDLLRGVAEERQGTLGTSQAVTVLGAVGADATVTTPGRRLSYVRAVVIAGSAYTLVMEGSRADFRRMADSFRLGG
jgi:hypothetical protein